MPFTPQALGQMNLFKSHPIDTEFVIIYSENGMVRFIPITDRAAPDIMAERKKGEFRALRTVRLSKKDSVRASELLGIADATFPLEQRLRTAVGLTNERMGQLRTDMEATKELHRLGALQGKLLDADGTTVVYDYFAEFGVAAPVVIDLNFATLTEAEIAIVLQETFYMPMMRSLQVRNGGQGMALGVTVGALVGDTFWGKLMRHPGFREIYKLEMQARAIARATNPLVTPPVWTEIEFGGVRWIHYMGATTGPLRIVTDEARFFPIGAQDVFDVYWSPGETLGTVTGVGREEYPIIRPDPRNDPEFVDLTLRSYPLYCCIYPKALMRARAI
jgi:hypothetical protein